MPQILDTGVPTSIKRPGAFHKYAFSTAGRSLIPLEQLVFLAGIKSAAGTAVVEIPVEVFDEADASTKFGQGSELHLMCAKAFEQGALQGVMPRLFGTPIAAPAGVAAAETLTVSGPATASGTLIVRIAGRYVSVGVSSGDSANTIAAALDLAIKALYAKLPVTSGVAGAVVTCTHVTTGVCGNDVAYSLYQAPAGVGVAFAQSVAGTGAASIVNALDSTLAKQFWGGAIGNHTSTDVTNAKAHTATAWGYAQKRPRHVYMADVGALSVAQALATAANDYTIIVNSYEGCPNTPAEVATAVLVYVYGKERPNANYDFGELALYPTSDALAYINTEIESGLAGGVTVLYPKTDTSMIVRLVTTHVLTGSAPDFATFDLATSRTAAYLSLQVDARYQVEFPQELLVTDVDDPDNVLKRVRDMVIGIHRDAEELRIIRDVDRYIAAIQVVENVSVIGRLDCVNPFRVVSPLHQAAFLHHAYI